MSFDVSSKAIMGAIALKLEKLYRCEKLTIVCNFDFNNFL